MLMGQTGGIEDALALTETASDEESGLWDGAVAAWYELP
jgi:hypothetical protein